MTTFPIFRGRYFTRDSAPSVDIWPKGQPTNAAKRLGDFTVGLAQAAVTDPDVNTEQLKKLAAKLGPQPVPKPDPKQIITELEVSCACDVKPKEYKWLWENKIPLGEQTVFCGMPDTGKSTVALDVAARASTKREFPDGSPCEEAISVLMMTTEDSESTTIVPRLIVAGANLDRIYFASKMNIRWGDKREQRIIALDTDISIIDKHLKANPQIGLVILESIDSYLGHAKKNDGKDMRAIMDRLKEVAEARNIAIIVIDHFNKNATQSALHRLSGSAMYGAAPRAVWLFAKDEEDPTKRLMLPMKLNIVSDSKKTGLEYTFRSVALLIEGRKAERGAIEWGSVTRKSADAVVGAASDPEANKVRQAMDFYREKLADGPKLSHKLYEELEAMSISLRTAKRARQKLGLDVYQEGLKWWTALAKGEAQ